MTCRAPRCQCVSPCDSLYEPEPELCEHCTQPITDDPEKLGDGSVVCRGCYEAAPWYTECCGYEVTDAIDLDYGICRDCKEHCEFSK